MNYLEYLLAPFDFMIEQIFLFSYNLTGNYGVAVVLLSFAVSLLLLPVFILIERAKKRDDAVKRKMKPVLDEIKRCYKGQERYYYTRTLHRQHGYSSFRALVPVLSLLLQIPFFIAAYRFLEHYEPLAGQGFLLIDDLSAPDRLLGQVNLLPILMTIVNLATAWFYTRNGDTSERRQMVVVAGIFLVLLYNFPSGLVLYWTMNNVFSFFRLFITNPENFRSLKSSGRVNKSSMTEIRTRFIALLPKLYRTFFLILGVLILFQLNWAFQNNFNDIALRMLLSVPAGIGITMLVALLPLFLRVELPEKKLQPGELMVYLLKAFKPMLIVITGFAMLSQLKWALDYNFNDFAARIVLAAVAAIIATLFLAALTLYYRNQLPGITVNLRKNIFSPDKRYRVIFWSLLTVLVSTQLMWAVQHNFKDIILRMAVATGISWLIVLLFARFVAVMRKNRHRGFSALIRDFYLPFWVWISLLFLTVYFYFGSKYYYGGVNKDLEIIAFAIMVIGQLTGLLLFMKHARHLGRIWSVMIIAALSLVVIFQGINLVAGITEKEVAFSVLNLEITLVGNARLIHVVLPGIIFISIIALTIFRRRSEGFVSRLRSDGILYLLSILYLLGFIFLWNPLAVYASYPSSFDFTAFDILKNNIVHFLIAFASLTAIYFLVPGKIKTLLLVIAASAAAVGFLHNTIVPINMGTLQDAVFLKKDNLAKPVSVYFAEGIGILFIVYGIVWLFRKGYHKQFRYALIALNVVLVTHSLVVAGSTGSFFQKQDVQPNPTSAVSFSKDGQNVVVLVLDMFHGWYVNKIMEEEPELKELYDGFVWYPNTLSVSSITGSSIGAMLGGYQYTIDKLNQDATLPLHHKITDIVSGFNTEVRNKGYGFSGNRVIYSTVDSIRYDTFLPKWHDNWDHLKSKLNIGLAREVNFDLLWNNAAFYSVPLIFKPRIYNQGEWLMGEVENNQNTSRTQPYNFLRLLPHISNTGSPRPNFIYLYGSATHHPWDIIDDDGVIHTDVSPYENNKWALKTLATWIAWMKENEVYDNTKIIFVSDHGPHWWYYKGEVDTDIPIIPNTRVKRINEYAMGLFALLLVKDFEKEGALKEDWRFMSNADVKAIVLDEDDPTKSTPPLSRTLPSSVVLWERKLWELNQLRIIQKFEVTDNMYDLNNWKIVD
ncbi:MAG: membrane protein insertase YidC [Bacteroidales bacterium]|nr:membrane protein insertase YidC [Bacteroidales bacterium]